MDLWPWQVSRKGGGLVERATTSPPETRGRLAPATAASHASTASCPALGTSMPCTPGWQLCWRRLGDANMFLLQQLSRPAGMTQNRAGLAEHGSQGVGIHRFVPCQTSQMGFGPSSCSPPSRAEQQPQPRLCQDSRNGCRCCAPRMEASVLHWCLPAADTAHVSEHFTA